MNKHIFSISVLFLLQIFYILDSSKISFINNKFFNNQEEKNICLERSSKYNNEFSAKRFYKKCLKFQLGNK